MNKNHNKPVVAVITTGGTIASKRGENGASTPTLSGEELLGLVPNIDAELRVIDLMARDSASLTLADMQHVSDTVGSSLANPEIQGVVVLHGTDAMEETALLLHLQHKTTKPVILTGAQFTADHHDADGPVNLAHALRLALDCNTTERGVSIAFGGRVLSAWGVYKARSDNADAFHPVSSDPRKPRLNLFTPIGDDRIDTIAIYPGCDALHINASIDAGARGIVLAALGSGNATPAVAEAVKECVRQGIAVVVSSRVPEGLLTTGYGGGGGGHDLAAAGAIHARTLRPGQARILLAALIANNCAKEAMVSAFNDEE